jgi:hypothetical protein
MPEYECQSNIPNEYLSLFQNAGAMRFFSDGVGLDYAAEPTLCELLRKTFQTQVHQNLQNNDKANDD